MDSEIKNNEVNWREYDGSDIFQFKNWTGLPIVNEKVKKLIENHKLKGFKFEELRDYVGCDVF